MIDNEQDQDNHEQDQSDQGRGDGSITAGDPTDLHRPGSDGDGQRVQSVPPMQHTQPVGKHGINAVLHAIAQQFPDAFDAFVAERQHRIAIGKSYADEITERESQSNTVRIGYADYPVDQSHPFGYANFAYTKRDAIAHAKRHADPDAYAIRFLGGIANPNRIAQRVTDPFDAVGYAFDSNVIFTGRDPIDDPEYARAVKRSAGWSVKHTQWQRAIAAQDAFIAGPDGRGVAVGADLGDAGSDGGDSDDQASAAADEATPQLIGIILAEKNRWGDGKVHIKQKRTGRALCDSTARTFPDSQVHPQVLFDLHKEGQVCITCHRRYRQITEDGWVNTKINN